MQAHPLAGVEMLASSLISPLVKVVVRSHHERWDGSGYPDGKAGEEIHEFARIAAVADVYDAVTSQRVYAWRSRPTSAWRSSSRAPVGPSTRRRGGVREVVAPIRPASRCALERQRGVVASVPAGPLDRPVVRVGWEPSGGGHPVRLDTMDRPDLQVARGPPPPSVARPSRPSPRRRG